MPRTDGKGPQEEYAEEVKPWSAFNDLLPDSNAKKLDKKLRSTILKVAVLRLCKVLVTSGPQENISKDDGRKDVENAIHKID